MLESHLLLWPQQEGKRERKRGERRGGLTAGGARRTRCDVTEEWQPKEDCPWLGDGPLITNGMDCNMQQRLQLLKVAG